MTLPSEATLFEQVADVVMDTPFLFVTNRYNLLEFLSAGYVTPLQGVSKHYADLLSIAPGRVPLLRGPIDQSLVDAVSSEDEAAFPVAFELASDVNVSGGVPALLRDRSVGRGDLAGDAVVLAPDSLIPLSWVRVVHFRTQNELNEHLAREYENIRPDAIQYAVTPHLFGGGTLSLTDLSAFLAALPLTPVTSDDLENLDRLAGARGALLASSQPTVAGLRAATAILAGKPPTSTGAPKWLAAPFLNVADPDTSADGQLFAAAVEVLRQEDRSTEWRPLAVLGRVEEALLSRKLTKKDAADVEKNLRPIWSILRNERDFKPFKPSEGLSSAKAVLLVLLRPDCERVMHWSRTETGATDVEHTAAAVLAGLLRGHKRSALELRTAGVDELLALRAATAVARLAADPLIPGEAGALTVDEELEPSGAAIVRLHWRGRVVLERVRQPPSAAERLTNADLSAGSGRAAAVAVCRRLGWHDCARTVVIASQVTVAQDARAKAMRVTIEGLPEIVVELDQVRLRERLSSEVLPEDLAADVVRLLGPLVV
jgi:hypothetical protein